MRGGVGAIAVAVVVVALAGCAPGGTASDSSTTAPPTLGGGADAGSTRLTIVARADASADSASVTLTCDPVGGTHPDPTAACAAVQSEAGISAFAPVDPDQACTEIYGGPREATVAGTLRGADVESSFTRANGCQIARWDALAALFDPVVPDQPIN